MKKRMDLRAAENRVIYLGRRGENLANTIEIDASPMRKEFPECTFLLMVQRPGESSAYSAAITMDGDVVSWPLTNADTGIAGDGCAEMRAMVGDTIAKTALFRTHIDESMNLPQEETPPAPQKGWLDQALAAQVKAEEAAQSAKNSADTVEATINAVIDKATAATSSATQAATNANSAAQTAQTVADTVQTKLDNGDFVGPAGKPGSDASVTADNIQAALGYTPVKDVQVAGRSVLDGGVAKVSIAQGDAPGVVSILSPQDSGILNDNGSLKVSYATDEEISSRTGTRKAIVCANMDYAVKAAMTDGKGPAWTAAEQKAARERMGIPGDYELIEEIVLTEESRVARSKEPDGAPYNFATIMTRAEFPASDKTGNIYISYNIGNEHNYIKSYFLSPYKADAVKYGYSKVWVENGRYRSGWWSCVENHGQYAEYYENPMQQDKYSIADGNIIGFSTDAMAAGTKITIYGVRAQ